MASYTAIAASNLAGMIHTAGKNHANAENQNVPGAVEIPAAPSATTLEHAMHPTRFSTGGLRDTPGNWSIVVGKATKKWADPDTGKMRAAGSAFGVMANVLGEVTIPATTPDDPPLDVGQINSAIDRVIFALDKVVSTCKDMTSACNQTAQWSDLERANVKAVLLDASIIIGVIETLPRVSESLKEVMVEMVKRAAAASVDRLLNELDKYIAGPPQAESGGPYPPGGTVAALGTPDPIDNNATHRGGTYSTATSVAQNQLAPLLGRYARPAAKVRFYDPPDQGRRMGKDGEDRAIGSPPQTKIEINGRVRQPDLIDRANKQVVEVKNKSNVTVPPDFAPNSTKNDLTQIKDSIDYAKSKGYSMVLVVDHRTQLPPEIQELARNGELTVVRQELNDGLPWQPKTKDWAEPKPFLPPEGWTVPDPYQTQPYSGYPK